MGENWVTGHIGEFPHNFQAVNVMGTAFESCAVSNLRDFGSRAYVNPSIVNCVTVPKKIHINPNFKANRILLLNDKALESGSVHINPHFNPKKFDKKKEVSRYLCDRLEGTPNGDEEILINKQSQGPSPFNPRGGVYSTISDLGCTQTINVTSSVPISKCSLEPKTQKNQSVTSIVRNLDIKTRHKIVHANNVKSQSHVINNYKNSNGKLLNQYKLINVGRSETEDCPVSKNSIHERRVSGLGSSHLRKEKGHLFNKNLKQFKHCVKKNSLVNKITNPIKTKYVYASKMSWHTKRPTVILSNSKHKLDKRKIDFERDSVSVSSSSSRKVLPKSVTSHRMKTVTCLWKSLSSNQKPQNLFTWRKREKREVDMQRIKNTYPNRTVVKIGGIMYKSSSNKLTRAKAKKKEVQATDVKTTVPSKMRHHIVYVRGEKFLLDLNGKTLIRQPELMNQTNSNKSIVKRIDLGGVTYIQNSNNVLIRTNTHHARQLVHSAKQKSIALLQHLRKRNNMPCMIYQRFGICRRHNKGMCIYVHDPKNIDLCKKFLKGECHNSECRLSHNAVKEKMATCHFFLKGTCSKENCPYLHVKVNKKAVICRDFLQGFCKLGQNCTKRHIHQCPDFEERGVCKRSSCPYPHKTHAKRKTKNSKHYKTTKMISSVTGDKSKGNLLEKTGNGLVKKNGVISKYENLKKRKLKMEKRHLDMSQPGESGNEPAVECIPKRVKLAELPLFIPLQSE